MAIQPAKVGFTFAIRRAEAEAGGFEIKTAQVTVVRFGAPANEPKDETRFAVRTPEGENLELCWAHKECGGCTYAVYNWPHGKRCVACWQEPAP